MSFYIALEVEPVKVFIGQWCPSGQIVSVRVNEADARKDIEDEAVRCRRSPVRWEDGIAYSNAPSPAGAWIVTGWDLS